MVVENDMGKDRAEEKCELERETGFEPATLALAILKIEILERLD